MEAMIAGQPLVSALGAVIEHVVLLVPDPQMGWIAAPLDVARVTDVLPMAEAYLMPRLVHLSMEDDVPDPAVCRHSVPVMPAEPLPEPAAVGVHEAP